MNPDIKICSGADSSILSNSRTLTFKNQIIDRRIDLKITSCHLESIFVDEFSDWKFEMQDVNFGIINIFCSITLWFLPLWKWGGFWEILLFSSKMCCLRVPSAWMSSQILFYLLLLLSKFPNSFKIEYSWLMAKSNSLLKFCISNSKIVAKSLLLRKFKQITSGY